MLYERILSTTLSVWFELMLLISTSWMLLRAAQSVKTVNRRPEETKLWRLLRAKTIPRSSRSDLL